MAASISSLYLYITVSFTAIVLKLFLAGFFVCLFLFSVHLFSSPFLSSFLPYPIFPFFFIYYFYFFVFFCHFLKNILFLTFAPPYFHYSKWSLLYRHIIHLDCRPLQLNARPSDVIEVHFSMWPCLK